MAFDYNTFSKEIDSRQDEFIEEFKEWIAIPSVSGDYTFRKHCFEMIGFVEKKLKDLDFEVQVVANPVTYQTLANGDKLELPPIILGSKIRSSNYKTVCIYGHLDVQPAKKEDGWDSEPFELTINKNDCLIGRGTSDDKGPVFGLLCALRVLDHLKGLPSINVKVCLEAMEESGSIGLNELVENEKNKFFANVDFVCICDTYWLGTKKPCISYGLRGIAYFHLEVSGFKCDLHSGLYGGMVKEPMTDLMYLMSKLVDKKGHILIPGIYDQVDKLTEEESTLYKCIDYDIEEIKAYAGTSKLMCEDKESLLMNNWRYPSLSIHGVEGAFDGCGDKTVIPRKVIGKFSIRLVPHMEGKNTIELVNKYINGLFAECDSPNTMKLFCSHADPGWVTDITHPNYIAAKKACEKVYEITPDFTRIGGSIPVATTFDRVLNKNVLLMSIGRSDDGAHSQNEKIDKFNFICGIKLFGAYLEELSHI